MTISQKNTVRRLKIFGLSDSAAIQIVTEVNRLLQTNGPEWTISRLKTMKVAFIHKIGHLEPEWLWIKTRSGLPVGPFRSIFNLKKPHKVLNSLMVYSQIISPTLTDKQWNKFHSSVVKVRDNPFNLFDDLPLGNSLDQASKFNFRDARISRMLLSTVRSPSIDAGKMKTDRLDAKQRLRSANHFLARSYINRHFSDSLPEWFNASLSRNWSSVNSVYDGKDSDGCVGRISFLQEPGFKLRAIANPLPIFQILLDPLKESLLSTLREIPNDFTHDQEAGVDFIQNLLANGVKTSSVDLSDATNHLPFDDQLNMLYYQFGKGSPEVDLFRDVSRGQWIVDSPNGEMKISWGTGQPLGLGPSFPSFALYHHLIMRYVISLVKDNPMILQSFLDFLKTGNIKVLQYDMFEYAIVGDDIVMNSIYTDTYIRVIEMIECKISYDKCIFNTDIAEFCSRIITKDKVYRAYKWKVVSDSSFIQMCKAFGPNILPLLRPRQKAIAKSIGSIPDTLGGPIGWNPDGKCLLQREAELWKLAEQLNDLKTEEDISVPRSKVHFLLKQSLGLIPFRSVSLNDMVNSNSLESVPGDPRQRFIQELHFQLKNGNNMGSAISTAKHLYLVDEAPQNMTEIERKVRNFVIDPESNDSLVDGDLFIKKLYTLLFKD